jgi:tRNA-dihydrouridine synthase B
MLKLTDMSNFSWKSIEKPVVALAPMSGVSDIAMRSIARRWGSDITFSEFISTDALHYKVAQWLGIAQPKGIRLSREDIIRASEDSAYWENDKSFVLAKFIEEERPFIIQVFGNKPAHFYTTVTILNHLFKPDGFDINFGCPARSVINNGAGSCLFLQPTLAKQIIETVKEACDPLPVSIKLRASYKHVPALEFLQSIDGAPFESVTLHMRSYDQVHHGTPNWDSGKELKAYLITKDIPLIVNGGIASGQNAVDVLNYTGADGVMVAQASLGNPFIFAEIKAALAGKAFSPVTIEDRISTVLAHTQLMLEHKGNHGIIEMRKHLLWYFKGFPNAAELRKQLSAATTIEEIQTALYPLLEPEQVTS